jgi:hypothetical protein
MEATYVKLNSGEWGVRVVGEMPDPGTDVTIRKRSGDEVFAKIGHVVWTADDKKTHLCALAPVTAEVPSPAPFVPPAAPASAQTGFVIPDRKLIAIASAQGALSEYPLTLIETELTTLHKNQRPHDIVLPLSALEVGFGTRTMAGTWTPRVNDVEPGRSYLFTRTGAGQVAREVLPGRFFSGLRQLVQMDEQGAQLGTDVWNKFATKATTRRLVRTIRTRVGSDVRWAIRSCHSTGYAPYDNLDLVRDILQNAGDFAAMPVIACHVFDTGMRLRFYAIDRTVAAFMHMDNNALLNEPIPMIEVWNSEVGRRRVTMRAGLYRVVSSTGLTCWSDKDETSWIHRGKSTRIAKGVRAAFTGLLATAAKVIEVYQGCKAIEIDDPEAYLVAVLHKHGVADGLIVEAKKKLADPVITPGESLASVVDAIAVAGQNASDLYAEEETEKLASQIMIEGYRKATKEIEGFPINKLFAEDV